jgi:predicted acetyltransferase
MGAATGSSEVEVRGARADEMSEVLDLLPQVMAAPREYFAAAYRNDPLGRPEHSRIVRHAGRIVSHLRLYDRWQLVGGVPVHVGCIGDVCTLPEYRNRGYCRALLENALAYWDERDYDLSMIASGVGVYAACGWVTVPERAFTVPPQDRQRSADHFGGTDSGIYSVRRFVRDEDLSAVAAVYTAHCEGRSLPTVRSAEYWRRHFAWISGEVEEAFLVAEHEGEIVAYIRCEGRLAVSEFCYLNGHKAATRPLFDAVLSFAARRRCPSLSVVPPTDHPVWELAEELPGFEISRPEVLLFRLVNLSRLLTRLEPLLSRRAASVVAPSLLGLRVGEQDAWLALGPGRVKVVPAPVAASPISVPPAAFFRLLFGIPEELPSLEGIPPDGCRALRTLFPPGHPVAWGTDVV